MTSFGLDTRGGHLGGDDVSDRALQVTVEHVGLGQLAVPVSCQPDLSQRPPLGREQLWVEHRPEVSPPVSWFKPLVLNIFSLLYIFLTILENPHPIPY